MVNSATSSLHFSLMNAICSFIGIYFNAKNRPHISLTKEEAKVSFTLAFSSLHICTAHSLCTVQDMFKRLVDAVPEVKFELYSFKTTIKCKEMLEQDCWFENKVKQELDLHPASAQQLRVAVSGSNIVCTAGEFQLFAAGEAP